MSAENHATSVLFLSVCVLMVTVVSGRNHAVHVVRRQINIPNIDAALRNPSFVRFHLSCLLARGACDGIGYRIRSLLPEIVNTGQCTQCSKHEITNAGRVLHHIRKHYPVEYNQLERMY